MCGRTDIIEIYDDIKVVIHYSATDGEPDRIQYWDDSKPYSSVPKKNICLRFVLEGSNPPIAIGEEPKTSKNKTRKRRRRDFRQNIILE